MGRGTLKLHYSLDKSSAVSVSLAREGLAALSCTEANGKGPRIHACSKDICLGYSFPVKAVTRVSVENLSCQCPQQDKEWMGSE